jgi:hypothetical protein
VRSISHCQSWKRRLDIHSNGGRQPTKERTLRDFQSKSKIHSLDPPKMGEVELQENETKT